MDLHTALKVVLRKALANDGLCRGLHEACRAIEKGQAQLAVLAGNCEEADYSKLIEALCNQNNVNLITVPDKLQLGEWAGLCKVDGEGNARKVSLRADRCCIIELCCLICFPEIKGYSCDYVPGRVDEMESDTSYLQVVGCSCAVVTDFGEESEALTVLQQHLSAN